MSNYGAWIGGAIGWAFGGPIGGILGYTFGKMFTGQSPTVAGMGARNQGTQPGDFAAALLVLSAAVMKADGKVLKSELEYVRSFLKNNFGPAQAEQLTVMLKDILSRPIDARGVAEQIRHHMDHSKRLLLLQYLYGIAKADGQVHSSEIALLGQIAKWLSISEKDRKSIEEMFHSNDVNPYAILEIEPNASDTDVKKAYRRLVVKFHPDKVQDLGETHQKQAKERFVAIQSAYEQIKSERGMK